MTKLMLTSNEVSSVGIALDVSIEEVERANRDHRTTEVDREINEQMLRDLLSVQKN